MAHLLPVTVSYRHHESLSSSPYSLVSLLNLASISSSSKFGVFPVGDIINEILDKKLEVMKQARGSVYAVNPRISYTMVSKIKEKDLSGAVFLATCE